MTKSLIVYFSQGGTTARVAEAIAAGLRSAGTEAALFNLKDAPPAPTGYDLLGIGLPAYIFRPPFNVLDYLKKLPPLAGLPAFVFVLHGTQPGDAGNLVRKALAQKGAREVGYFRARGADYFVGYVKRGHLFSAGHPTAEELAAAETFGRDVAARLAGQPYAPPAMDPGPNLVYRMEQLTAHRWFVEQLYTRLFLVDKQKCTACGLCVKTCPQGNITPDQAGRPVWGRDCLFCLYCEMKCPADAVFTPMDWPIMAPFLIYNVRAAAHDPALNDLRVTHTRGQTRPLT